MPASLDIDMWTTPKSLTQTNAPAVLQEWVSALSGSTASGQTLHLDLQPLQQFDSAALAALLGLRRACENKGLVLQIAGAPKGLQELARVYGIDQLVMV